MGRKRKQARLRKQAAGRPARGPGLAHRARAFVVAWLPVVAIVLVTRVTLAETYYIPSGSMEPTLLVGDRLVVNKLRYGPHVPLTRLRLPGYATPARGDVVVFESPPQDPAIRIAPYEVTPTLVKRIVGVAGDTLLMRGGVLFVNGRAEPPRALPVVLPDSVADRPLPLFGWQHAIAVRGSRFGPPIAAPSLHEWGPLVVPPGTYFVMGDNRDDSVDSRFYGLVPRENLRGAPTFVYYSYDTDAGVPYFRALTEIRWRRLGTWIR